MKRPTRTDIEAEIHVAWVALARMPTHRRRTLFLSPRHRVVWLGRDLGSPKIIEIGTYDRNVTLCALREDVEWACKQAEESSLGSCEAEQVHGKKNDAGRV